MIRGDPAAGVGKPATFVVRRDGKPTKTVTVTPQASPDDPKKAVVGMQIGTGYDFPFDVSRATSATTSAGPAPG